MYVGTNIKERRLKLKMSQQDLADAMGYKTRSTIAKIESGENDVSQSKLYKFATVLGVTVEDLISNRSYAAATSPLPSNYLIRDKNKNIAIILAGGNSLNSRQTIPNQFISVHGKPIIVYCMDAYQSHPAIDDIYVVCLRGWESIVSAYARQFGITKLKGIVPGGDSGIASLKNAIDHVRGHYSSSDIILIQESTRPMVSVETVSKLLLACSEKGSATIYHPMNEYVQFRSSNGRYEYIDRNAVIALQSPEAHRLSLVTDVFDKINLHTSMNKSCFAMLMYELGYEINFIESSINNIKIVREEDIAAFGMLANSEKVRYNY